MHKLYVNPKCQIIQLIQLVSSMDYALILNENKVSILEYLMFMKKVVSIIAMHEHHELMLSLMYQDERDNFQKLKFSLPLDDIILLL